VLFAVNIYSALDGFAILTTSDYRLVGRDPMEPHILRRDLCGRGCIGPRHFALCGVLLHLGIYRKLPITDADSIAMSDPFYFAEQQGGVTHGIVIEWLGRSQESTGRVMVKRWRESAFEADEIEIGRKSRSMVWCTEGVRGKVPSP
jgi:hypothetical protein